MTAPASNAQRQYFIVTGNYWAFTLTDGALRMLVVLYFHQLGYSPLGIALLFVFYEVFGVITNAVGGWLGARLGLNKTMNIGLGLQIMALAMLLVPTSFLSVGWVMASQALSGVAKDLNKMSAKSSVKMLLTTNADQNSATEKKLYRWVALLTGSKNALKGVGFFLGAWLLAAINFQGAIAAMALSLTLVWILSLIYLKKDLGKAKNKPKFSQLFSNSRAINYLSAARLFLFSARDIWFVIALPVFLSQLGWSSAAVGSFMACWVIGYGAVQALAPKITRGRNKQTPDGRSAYGWALALSFIPAAMALALHSGIAAEATVIIGLMIFGILFAINSSLHSYLIVSYADQDHASLNIGFYYMANAMGRLLGTVLSGLVYQFSGLAACLMISAMFIVIAAIISRKLPHLTPPQLTSNNS